MGNPHVITLRKPVGPEGKQITELTLREPRAGEVLRASRETGRGVALSLLTQVTGLDISVIQALPGRVSDRAATYLMQSVEPILAEQQVDQTDPPDELTIDLAETIQAGTTWVSKLELHEPTLMDLIKSEKHDGMQRVLVLVALASNLPRAIIEMLPISEYAKAANYCLVFIQGVPSSGAESADT